MILMWIVAGVLAALGVASIMAKLSQFGLLFIMLAAWLPISTYVDLPGWVHVVFWITLLIGFAVAVIVAANPAFFAVLGMFLLIAVIVIWSFIASAPAMANENLEAGSAQVAASSVTDSAEGQGDQQPAPVGVGSPPVVDANNLNEWKVDLSTNPQHNYIEKGIPGETAEEKTHNLLEAAKHNPYLLSTQAYAANLWNDANNVAPLISADGLYISAEGQALHAQLAALYQSGEVFIGLAPENALNTGYSSDGVTATQGITGDRTALVVQKDNVTLVTLVRCANTVFPAETKSIPHAKVVPAAQPPASPPAPGTTSPTLPTSPSTPGTSSTPSTSSTSSTTTTPSTTTSSTTSTSSTTTTPSTTTSTTTTPSTTSSTTSTSSTSSTTSTPSTTTTTETLQTKDPKDDISQSSVVPLPVTGDPEPEDTQEDSPPEFTEQDPGDAVDIPAPDIEEPPAAEPSGSTSEEPVVTVTNGVPTDPEDPGTGHADPDDQSDVAETATTSPAGTTTAGALSGLVLLGGLKLRPRRTTRRKRYVRQH